MEIYRNGVFRVRFLMGVSLAFLGTMALVALSAAARFGLAAEDGGVLRPLAQRAALGGGLLLLGLVFPVLMTVYARRYVVRLAWRAEERALEVETVGWLRRLRRRVPAADVLGARGRQEHFTGPGGMAQSIYWESVRLRGERLPLIVDLGGEVLEPAAMKALRQEGAPTLLSTLERAEGETPPRTHSHARRRRGKE